MAKITLNINNEIIDEYYDHLVSFNFFFAKRHESETYRKNAMKHQKRMQQIQEILGYNALLAIERLTGKSIMLNM